MSLTCSTTFTGAYIFVLILVTFSFIGCLVFIIHFCIFITYFFKIIVIIHHVLDKYDAVDKQFSIYWSTTFNIINPALFFFTHNFKASIFFIVLIHLYNMVWHFFWGMNQLRPGILGINHTGSSKVLRFQVEGIIWFVLCCIFIQFFYPPNKQYLYLGIILLIFS